MQVVGKCVRCQMVCVDPHRGGRSPEPLKTLLALRGSNVRASVTLRDRVAVVLFPDPLTHLRSAGNHVEPKSLALLESWFPWLL